MKHKSLYILFVLCFFFGINASAQRNIASLETNADLSMDSRPDSLSGDKKKKVVPVDVKAWTIDKRFGTMTPVVVDTLQKLYFNSNLPEGKEGHYSTLGNVGSPRQSRIFFERKPMSNFLFADNFDMFLVPDDEFVHYNTKSPFVYAAYNTCGTKTTGYDHVKVVYTNNAGKRLNFGGLFDYIYGQGYYDQINTSHMGGAGWVSYLGDHYDMHLSYQHNFSKIAESGGITDERYITNPDEMPGNYTSNDIPTYLSSTWNRQEYDKVHLNHHYNFGFYKTVEVDSVTTKDVFVPVSNIFHTLRFQNAMHNTKSYRDKDNYHSYTYLPGDSINDYHRNLYVSNVAGLSLCEGFNKWAVFGLSAYVGYEYSKYTMPDSLVYGGASTNTNGHIGKQGITEHNVMIGGQIIRTQGKFVHYNADAEFVLAGENIGQFEVKGHGEVNIPFLKDTAQIAVNAYIKNTNPAFFFRHFHSKHAYWDIDPDYEFRQRVEGIINLPLTRTKVTVSLENIKNYSYFANTGYATTLANGNKVVTNNVSPMQCSDNIQVVGVNLRQDFKLGIFHLDNDVSYQMTSNKAILPLPMISTYNNLYLKFKIAKVLDTELGADVRYFTSYYAPDYSVVNQQFMTQNANKKVKIGNYPITSVYANFELKTVRFYVQYYHANQDTGRYFWAPGYPVSPAIFRLGLSWNFHD